MQNVDLPFFTLHTHDHTMDDDGRQDTFHVFIHGITMGCCWLMLKYKCSLRINFAISSLQPQTHIRESSASSWRMKNDRIIILYSRKLSQFWICCWCEFRFSGRKKVKFSLHFSTLRSTFLFSILLFSLYFISLFPSRDIIIMASFWIVKFCLFESQLAWYRVHMEVSLLSACSSSMSKFE